MREGLVEIDGSHGEGGGQILRTSLALSIITGRPLEMRNIRAGRAKPGLRRQHLTCVEAAAALCTAELKGAHVGSQHLWFTPREATTETELAFDIGTAGSTTLVVQTILIPAIIASAGGASAGGGKPLRFSVAGGTHNPMAPPFDFLARVFAPHLRAMGANVELVLDKHGFVTGAPVEQRREGRRGREDKDKRAFYDAPSRDRGQLTVVVEPGALAPIDITDISDVTSRHATAIVAGLPAHVATRELEVVRERLGLAHGECEVRELSGGPANLLMIEIERGHYRELIATHGEKGLRAETVAARACDEVEAFVSADVPVGEHLADQLLLPMAVGARLQPKAGISRFRSAPLSLHATTNIDTIAKFIDVPIRVIADGTTVIVEVGAIGSGS